MIVHVYNPERILNTNSSYKSVKQPANVSNKVTLNVVSQEQSVSKPPPSPRLLRQSVFKGFNSKASAPAATTITTTTETRDTTPSDPPCVPAKKQTKLREAMDSNADGLLPPWASRGLPTTPSLTQIQMACTCQCNSAEPVSLSLPSQVSSSSREQQLRETSTTSSHYFTPVTSFNSTVQHDDGKELDSLEYRPVKESPSPTRKASLDRILSPQVTRRSSPFTSSPQPGGLSLAVRDKSLSPVVAVPLSTSMSNASIQSGHSTYSEDSLIAGQQQQHRQRFAQQNCQQCAADDFTSTTPAAHRWNNVNYETHSGHWIPETGLCMAVEKRPVATTSASSQLLDFSKDSLNSTGLLDKSTVNPVQQQATPTRHVVEEEEEENSCTDTVKLEPLAFTIDFGDVTPGKKKETPKRFAERLASIGGHSKRAPSSKAEVKKSESGVVSETSDSKMLKSLSNRLGGQISPLSKFSPEIETAETPRRSPVVAKTTKSTNPSRNSSVGRTNEMAKSNGLRKKPQEIVRRSPSPTPPPSPMKSNRAAYNNGSTRTCSTAAELKMQQSIESDEGGYDYHHDHHQEMLMTASTGSGRQTEVANANDSEAATETVEEEEDRCDDAASETGTYTIGKDSPSPDEDQSRRDIDRVFGLLPSTSLSSETCVSTVISAVGQVDSIESRSTPQWIREWAAQVAQQQETPLVHIVNIPANVAKPPSHPRPPPPELPTAQRPRRRLPSVPPAAASNSSSRSRSSPRPSDMSDPSDSSLETESFLRDTESVVSAMQARVDGRSSTESDAETRSSSSYRQSVHSTTVPGDLENSNGRKLSAQLRAKIRSLDEQYPVTSTTPTTAAVTRKTTYVMTANNTTTAAMNTSTTATTTNIIHNELHADDAKSLHSDSSLSDFTSGETSSRSRHTHEDHKTPNNVPAVRYNRALSLRRGRLGLDVEQSPPAPASAAGSSVSSKERRRTNDSPSRGSSPQVPAASSAPLARKLSSISTHSQLSTASAGSTRAAPPSVNPASFSRNDGGRFSLRLGGKAEKITTGPSSFKPKVSKSQSGNLHPPTQPHVNSSPPQPPPVSGARKSRSNSTLSSKEAEFQNWKRRKNYDPMKAAAEGKKKEAARRAATTTLTMSQSMIGTVTSSMVSSPSSQSPSPPPRTIIRSASFTCVNNSKGRSGGMDATEQQTKYNNNSRRTSHHKPVSMHNSTLLYSSDDENEMLYSPKKASPKPSPMTTRKYMGLNLMQTSSHNSPPSLPADFSDLASVTSNDVDLTSSPGSPRRKLYMEEGLLMRTSASNSSLRARTKLEALDNLVISTIYGMSSKIRSNAESLMRKLRPQYLEDLERLNLIDDALNRLSDCVTESPIHSVTAGRSSSRELSGTLKVMKRVEQVFQALDQVLFEDVLDGGGEEGAILNDGTTTEGEDWNGYTSGDFY